MKICPIKLIIPSLIFFLCNINSCSAYSCKAVSCPRRLNSNVSTTDVSVHSPFRLTSMQAKSCGYEGFDLHCNDTLGTLIQLPEDVVLHVDEIDYDRELLILSDPIDRCLPRKLLSLNLTDTPFHPANDFLFFSEKFWFYNCSVPNYQGYDQIDCLSGSNYTVISAKYDIIDVLPLNVCKFLKNLTVSTIYPSSNLSNISTIDLTWSGHREPLPPSPPSGSSRRSPASYYYNERVSLILPITGTVLAAIIVICCCCRCHYKFRRNGQATTSTINNQSRALATTAGLDQVTIDSYPVIVIGASGRLTNPDDTTCPICLSDYCPQETLKILPECNHQFHADCIDQWLRSNGVCPFCRASTHPRTSSNN